jgi:protein-S-isoprenylcysteine O-methyltransferase Ste14
MTSRLPALGPRGEGWVIGQVGLIGIIIVAGRRDVESGSASAWGPAASVAGLVAIGIGGLLAAWCIWDLRASLSPFPRPVAGAALVETGAYRWIRHPIYTGMVLAGVGWSQVTGSILALAATGLLFLLLVGKARREETWLVAAHPEYRAYQERTKRFIPWIY